MDTLVGRIEEQDILEQALHSKGPEFIAVYGRRRVGKTFLVRQYYGRKIVFEAVGAFDAGMADQLQNFADALQRAARSRTPLPAPQNWNEAFRQLEQWLESSKKQEKKVLFFDELPWLATRRSGMLQALSHFWNAWASKRSDIVLVASGSAASWIQENLINAKGGLHNRVTRRIRLDPFTVSETAEFYRSRKIILNPRQIIELYMAIGGVPHYLKEIRRGQSAAQAIDSLCFSENGLLRDEFERLYQSLFKNSEEYTRLIRTLATKRQGLSRNEIVRKMGIPSGGRFTKRLNELEQCGFVQSTVPFGKKTADKLYRLADEYSLFYLHWIEHSRGDKGSWMKKQASPKWRAWSGYAFETVCMKHIDCLKRALGIGAVDTEVSSWRYTPKTREDNGAQIDLLIDRKDDTINICEMKFCGAEFRIEKNYATELRNKREAFRRVTRTKKNLQITFVTSYGVKRNSYADELVASEVTMDALLK